MASKFVLITILALALTVNYAAEQGARFLQGDPGYTRQGYGKLLYVAAQSGCSASDQKLISHYSNAAVKALVSGDMERSVEVMQELDQKLSPGCLRELAQSQPVRTNCSLDEKKITLAHYEAVIQAISNADFMRMFDLVDHLEDSISRVCWIAVNYPQDAGVRQACSSSELTLIASAAGPARQAFKSILMAGDFTQTVELLQALSEKLSIDCQSALSRVQQPPPPPGRINRTQVMPGSIQDHGGGTYVMPGVGACTPSGCMSF